MSGFIRTDYYDDPNAPAPNQLMFGVGVAITDDAGRILLEQRTDNGLWGLPGGGMWLSESATLTAIREAREETGYEIEITGIVGIYTDPRHIMAYVNGEVFRQCAIVLAARVVRGQLERSEESLDVAWFMPDEIEPLPMHPTMRLRVDHALARTDVPYLG